MEIFLKHLPQIVSLIMDTIWGELTCLQLDFSYLIGQTAAPAPLISNV